MAKSFRGSIRVGQAFGIDVFLHTTFLILLAVLAMLPILRGEGLVSAFQFTLLMIALFGCVLLHEFGHALMAWRFGIKTRDITLLPFGGIANIERLPDRPRDELLVAVAGPAVNLVIAAGLFIVLQVQALMQAGGWIDSGPSLILDQLMWMNVILAVFNLLPAFPMDGGRVLRAALATQLGSDRATKIAAGIGQGMAILLAALAFFNPMLLVVAGFIFLAAGAESRAQTLRTLLKDVSVRDVMAPRFQALEAYEPVSRAVMQLVAGFQQDFPVTFGGRVVGLVTRADLMKALSEHRQDVSLWLIMRRDVPSVGPELALTEALQIMQQDSLPGLPVVEEETLVGFLSLEGVRSYAMVQQAAATNPRAADWREVHPNGSEAHA